MSGPGPSGAESPGGPPAWLPVPPPVPPGPLLPPLVKAWLDVRLVVRQREGCGLCFVTFTWWLSLWACLWQQISIHATVQARNYCDSCTYSYSQPVHIPNFPCFTNERIVHTCWSTLRLLNPTAAKVADGRGKRYRYLQKLLNTIKMGDELAHAHAEKAGPPLLMTTL